MKINGLDKHKAEDRYNEFLSLNRVFVDNNLGEYETIRNEILAIKPNYDSKDKYGYDLEFACNLYTYFNSKEWFSINLASNYNFWRYICVYVIPDVIYERFDFSVEHYYKKDVRIYIPSLWWYIHMSFYKDVETTKTMLKSLNSDYILQLVERPGRNGLFLDLYREIMRVLCSLSDSVRNRKLNKANLFRRVLIQNTAQSDSYNLIIEDKTNEYVEELFASCGVELNND